LHSLTLSANDLEDYNNVNAPWAQIARERLAKALGYYPELQHSFPSEMYLRRYLAADGFNGSDEMQHFDYKAVEVAVIDRPEANHARNLWLIFLFRGNADIGHIAPANT